MTILMAAVAAAWLWQGPIPASETQRKAEAQRHYSAGEENMRSEAWEQAVVEFKAAAALDPSMVLAHYNLGQSYMALKRYPEAVQAYLGCREAVDRLNSLDQSVALEREREVDDQVRELHELVRRLQSSKQPDVGNQIMMVEERIRVLESTRRKGGKERGTALPELNLALGSAYLRQGLLSEAEGEYKAALSANSKLGAAHNNLAFVYMKTGRYDDAEKELKAAEKAGFRVAPQFKDDLKRLKQQAGAGEKSKP